MNNYTKYLSSFTGVDFPRLDDDKLEEFSCYIAELQSYAESVSSQWDGDEAGVYEDRATTAQDIIEKCNEINKLLFSLDCTPEPDYNDPNPAGDFSNATSWNGEDV
jgi:hypothetical protein